MAKKKATRKKPAARQSKQPKSFGGLIKGRARPVQALAKALRELLYEELPDAQESFHGGHQPIAMYRTIAEVCWIQPLTSRCNVYFMRGTELADNDGLLEGTSDRFRFVKVNSIEAIEKLPLREWMRETVRLNAAMIGTGMTFDEVLQKLRTICLALPQTKETLTWGKPHFRVGEKIFCGCGEQHGRASLGLKMDPHESTQLMQVPGVEKAPYSRPNDGWVAIDPTVFDDWGEIEQLLVGSYRLIAPKRTLKLLDSAG